MNHRVGLERFLDDGRLDLDTNVVERCIRPVVLSRKNALFASGDDGGAAGGAGVGACAQAMPDSSASVAATRIGRAAGAARRGGDGRRVMLP
jgi:hypothetical protein